jgi:hypothetical protein
MSLGPCWYPRSFFKSLSRVDIDIVILFIQKKICVNSVRTKYYYELNYKWIQCTSIVSPLRNQLCFFWPMLDLGDLPWLNWKSVVWFWEHKTLFLCPLWFSHLTCTTKNFPRVSVTCHFVQDSAWYQVKLECLPSRKWSTTAGGSPHWAERIPDRIAGCRGIPKSCICCFYHEYESMCHFP